MEMSGPFWPVILKKTQLLSDLQLQFYSVAIYIVPIISAMIFAPLWGTLGDKYGHKAMVVRAMLGLSISQLLIGTANGVEMIIFYRTLQGVFAGLIAASMAYSSHFTHNSKAQNISNLQAATSAGIAFGPLVGGLFLEYFEIKVLFYSSGLFSLILAFIAFVFLLPIPKQKRIQSKKLTSEIASLPKELFFVLFIILILQSAKMFPTTFFVLYVQSHLHEGNLLTGLLYSATGFSSLFTAPFWGKYFDYSKDKNNYILLSFLCLLSAVSSIVHILTQNIWLILLARLMWGFFLAAMLSFLYSKILYLVEKEKAGLWLGFGTSSSKIGILIGISLGAAIISFNGIFSGFIFMSVLYFISSILIWVWQFYHYNYMEKNNV
jgi:MFS family permease